MGGGIAGGAAVVWGAFELLKDEPHEGFALLQHWGPWFLIALVAMWALHDLASQVLRVGDRIALSMENIAVEQQRQAVAQEKESEKDDRNFDRLQTLVSFAGQQSQTTLQRMDGQDATLRQILEQLKLLQSGRGQ